jgi:hypothetical protein
LIPTNPATAIGSLPSKERTIGSLLSLALYSAFALAVFIAQGSHPLLGPDHVTYMELADSIAGSRPAGDYWRETNSVRFYGVVLAYMHPWTGSHVLSMKILLAALTVPFLLSAELLFGLFTESKWQAVLFATVSAFAVSFGAAAWGLTDSTALLARTMVAPIILLCFWYWFRYRHRSRKYIVFPVLICASLIHLSTFYVIGVLGLLELWDFAANRNFRFDSQTAAFLASLVVAAGLLYTFEIEGVSVRVFSGILPRLFGGAVTFETPQVGVTRIPLGMGDRFEYGQTLIAPAPEAWRLELSLRPWRNMPIPMVNVANMFSSYALILLLAMTGMLQARRAGFTSTDREMVALFLAVVVFSFLPQTAMWILRSFTEVYPASMEEVRALSLVMIPSLYFILRFFRSILERDDPARTVLAVAVVIATLALPLGMKSLPYSVRERLLSVMTTMRMVDAGNPVSFNNARSALGISHELPFYYSTERTIQWFRANTAAATRILTDRDEFVLLREWQIIGPRQVAAVPARWGVELPEMSEVFFRTKEAMRSGDTAKVRELALKYGADYAVVPWRVPGAIYTDEYYSVIALTDNNKD